MRLSNKVLLASTNRGKLEEFQALFKKYPQIEILPAQDFIRNLDGLQHAERHATYLENAVAKARLVNLASHYPSLADDSGLEVDALSKRPGVRSHRYATPKAGISQDTANMDLLLKELGSTAGSSRTARFVCTVVLVIEGILLHATGTLEGTIVESARGENGFGYDPIFVPAGSQKTLAEMSDSEKNAISHRAKAVEALMKQTEAHGIVFAKP